MKWNVLNICAILLSTACGMHVERPDNVDEVTYFCGQRLPDMLSKYCRTFNSHPRRKRAVAQECCGGMGCSIRYAMTNYCQVIKPEYYHLFFNEKVGNTIDKKQSSEEIYKNDNSQIINVIKNNIRKDVSSTKQERHAPIQVGNSHQLSSSSTSSSPVIKVIKTNNKAKRQKKGRGKRGRMQKKCKCKRNKRRQVPAQSNHRKSYVGTDRVPGGHPVHAAAKYEFFAFK